MRNLFLEFKKYSFNTVSIYLFLSSENLFEKKNNATKVFNIDYKFE